MSVETRPIAKPQGLGVQAVLHLRFTILFLAVMFAANFMAGSLGRPLPAQILADWGIGYNALWTGEVFRLVTGIFLSHDTGMFVRQVIFAAAILGYTEVRFGALRTGLLFFGLDFVGTIILLACIGWSSGLADLTATNDVGMSIGGFGLIGFTLANWRGKWLLFLGILLSIAVKFSIAPDPLADGGHALALLLGFGLASFAPHIGVSISPAKARAC